MDTTLTNPVDTPRCFETVTPNVARISHRIVNSYCISDAQSGQWVLVDAGLRTSAKHILAAAAERFGPGCTPAAIILTHGHFDHVGALPALADEWKVPVFAHPLELPYLTGRCAYPPADPTVGGGLMSVMARFFTRGPINLGGRVRALPHDGKVPGLPTWRWIHTPGHTPGHVSLHQDDDGILIAGDAFVTTKQESALAVLKQFQQVNGPPAYFTPDWAAARDSVQRLAALHPNVAATGHGIPMRGDRLAAQLDQLAANFDRMAVPRRGRYVRQPAMIDERGMVIYVPPAVPDRARTAATLTVLIAAAATVLILARRKNRA